jgi:hypothetical protein
LSPFNAKNPSWDPKANDATSENRKEKITDVGHETQFSGSANMIQMRKCMA